MESSEGLTDPSALPEHNKAARNTLDKTSSLFGEDEAHTETTEGARDAVNLSNGPIASEGIPLCKEER